MLTLSHQHSVFLSCVGQVSHPESFVANASFYKMLHTANVEMIKLDCRLLGATAATDALTGVSKVASIKVFCEDNPITATVFIDASYDGTCACKKCDHHFEPVGYLE